jgi:hypothetical protein
VHVPEQIALYIDDELEEGQKSEMEKHLASCSICADYAADLRETKATIAEMTPFKIPDGFELKMKAALQREIKKPGIFRFNWRSMGAVAAVLMIGFFSYSMLINDITGSQSPSESGLMKSATAPELQAEISSSQDAEGLSDGLSATYDLNGDLKIYQELIQSKLEGYTYEILSVSSDPAEFSILIKNDLDGKILDKIYIIQYGAGKISSLDNWLGLPY